MKRSTVRPSVSLSVCLSHHISNSGVRRVCFCVLSATRAENIDRRRRMPGPAATAPQHGAQQMRAVLCWQPNEEAEHRLVLKLTWIYRSNVVTLSIESAVRCNITNVKVIPADWFSAWKSNGYTCNNNNCRLYITSDNSFISTYIKDWSSIDWRTRTQNFTFRYHQADQI